MSTAVNTRIIRNHEEWFPHGYQTRAVTHLLGCRAAALFLDPGLGKTAVVLAAFQMLKERGMARRMLVIAPLRVCQLVWQQEGRKWTQFRDLTFTLLHGPKKDERLHEQTDIHLINPEGIAWFAQQFYGRTDLPYDIVTIDELTKFKNARAARSKKLRVKLSQIKYRWGLTGSPAPNGYLDLFGQMLILDDGAALGRFITYFRDQYFTRGFDGFSYDLKPDGAARIEAKIAPYVLRMSADDYGSLPPQIDNVILIELTLAARKQYNEMKKELIISLPEGVVTAANAAAVYTKLAQLANGAVYVTEDTYAEVHPAKLDALEELIEELSGQQLLVAYEFRHDLHRLQERFPTAPTLTGLSHKKIVELEAAWNSGEIPVMFAHPASAGHGLNLQGSGAAHLCWFSKPWDLDLYDQFIRRLRRQGTTAQHIINHALVVKDSIDEIKDERLKDKDVTQAGLLNALNAEIIKDDPALQGEGMALKKLGFQGQAAEGSSGTAPVKPKGWGAQTEIPTEQAAPAQAEEPKRPRGWGAPEGTPTEPQREAINAKLRVPEPEEDEEEVPASVRALAAFPSGVVQQLTGSAGGDEPPQAAETTPAPRGWGATPAETPNTEPAKPEIPEKKATRSRRSATEAVAGTPTPPADTTLTGAASGAQSNDYYPSYTPKLETWAPYFKVEFQGVPAVAVTAALRAIADSMGQ